MTYNAKNILFIIFLLVSVDFAGDAVVRGMLLDINLPNLIFKALLSLAVLILVVSFGLKIPRKISFVAPFYILIGVILLGFVNGILSNNFWNALNETMPFMFVMIFLPICSIEKPISCENVESALKMLVYIVAIKVIIYLITFYILYDVPSWKILLKQSPLLLIPLCVYCSKLAMKTKPNESINFILFLIMVCAVFSQARMLIIGCVFVFSFYFLGRRIVRILPIFFIMGLSLLVYFLFIGDLGKFAEVINGSKEFSAGLGYRLVQFDIILDRLIEFPIFGVGFGYYTPGYSTYGLLAKPFLLELDILNFISKIGALGTFFYGLAYLLLFRLIKTIADDNVRRLSLSMFISLIALLVYSLGQTAHQSVNYWIFLGFVYGFVVSHLRAQGRIIN